MEVRSSLVCKADDIQAIFIFKQEINYFSVYSY